MSKQPKHIVHGAKVLRSTDCDLYSGWSVVGDIEVVTEEPKFKWKGAKIPYEIWEQCAAFMRWTQKEFKEESLITFFYNQTANTWAAWAFPQEPNGMTVKSLQDLPLYAEDRKRFGKDWIQFGSLHHHCTAGAFASGTDKDDEKDRDGIHITLGKLDEKAMDVHCRQTFDGIVSNTRLMDWVEIPDYLKAAPRAMQGQFGEFALRYIDDTPAFPLEWKERIFERTYGNPHMGGVITPQNFTMGRRRQRPAQTILGKSAESIKTGETANKETKASSDTVTATSKSHVIIETALNKAYAKLNDWEARMCNRIKLVLATLSLSPEEAYSLLSHVPDTGWQETDIAVRRELVNALNRDGIPHLYSEELCRKLKDMEEQVATC